MRWCVSSPWYKPLLDELLLGRSHAAGVDLDDCMSKPLTASLPAALALFALAGCSALPSSGPTERDVFRAEKEANEIGFKIVDVSPQVISVLESAEGPALAAMDDGSRAARLDTIGPGDTLGISIYEVGSGIFGGGSAGGGASGTDSAGGSTSALGARLPPLQVDGRGAISLPFIGRIIAAGHTPVELADIIRDGLKRVSQDPQVLVSITESLSNAVFVLGDVKNPGRRQLTLNREHLLDVIALSGGATYASQDTVVELSRNGHSARASLRHVEDTPSENVALRPGDRVRLVRVQRTFTVFGASGKINEVTFDTPTLNLAEGVARAGGPQDDRADPNAVFLFRFEQPDVASQIGSVPVAGAPAYAPRPVIYRLDMLNPSSYFLAQKFDMHNKDLIYIANARTNQLSKFVNIVYSLAIPAITAKQVTQ
jgi:polysaccharide export outer membrane protein